MKIIALLPFKNEEWILPTYLSSISKVADQIIAIDDGSTDNSRRIVEEAGAIVYESGFSKSNGWPEYEIRERLLDLGRAHGGTHFICLDADEAFTANFIPYARQMISLMSPGQKLSMQWLALWKSPRFYRDDLSVWSNNFKDFIFCDDGVSRHSYAFLGVGRTPGINDENTLITIKLSEYGGVLHYQFVSWDRFQMKQAWYRCSELINNPNSLEAINKTYQITLDDPQAKLKELPFDWIENITLSENFENTGCSSWHQDNILKFFDTYGVCFFESLQIWHIDFLRQEFFKRAKRLPSFDRPGNFHNLFFEILKKIKLVIRALK